MHAVNAIPAVCAAHPAIRTFLDLPLVTGRGVTIASSAGAGVLPDRDGRPLIRSPGGVAPTGALGSDTACVRPMTPVQMDAPPTLRSWELVSDITRMGCTRPSG